MSKSTKHYGERRQARVAALQTLYEVDIARHDPDEALARNAESLPAQPGGARLRRGADARDAGATGGN